MQSQRRTSSSTQSLDEHGEPQGGHHQHHLELVLNSLPYLQPFEAKAGLAVRPSYWTDSANRRASITSIIWNSVNLAPLSAAVRSQSRTSSSTQSLQQGSHHQHHLGLVLNSPSHRQPFETKAGLASNSTQLIGRIQRSAGRASPASSGTRVKLTLPSAAVRGQSRTSSSTQSFDGFSEPQGEHHQHHLELLLNSLSYLRPFEAKARLAVRPSHWTDSANRRASITARQLRLQPAAQQKV